ncbi:hypothetical protein EJP82_04275 [Paenibacillus anaericanus]|uniref:Uncharacterized protein n=1 Tax=Paenibacillus anaericanus TaxID=170367 RepID=A0A3S1CAL1_9BACL|nr:hypothetical protein [Paenibacillus anaericanus]RUT47604.1 hypothetical protein EJP82_04275 [Paenibacillus anaericanus]
MNKPGDNKENVWKEYIRRDAIQQSDEELESLLLQDDESLEAYITALTSLEHELPNLLDQKRFTDKVMKSLPIDELGPKVSSLPKWPRKWSRHPLFHYVIAASVTVILMSCGLFDFLTFGAEQVIHQTDRPSISQQLLDKTSGWIDKLKP